MTTLYTLALIALLIILAAFAVGGKAWGLGVLAFVVVVVIGLLGWHVYATGRWF